MSNSDTKTKEETGSNEHPEVDRRALENNGENHDDGSNANAPSSAHSVSNVGSDWQSEQRTQEHDTGEQALDGAGRVVHVVGELFEGQKTVDHGSIVTVGSLQDCQ